MRASGLELVVVVRNCFIQLQARFSSHQEDQENYPTGRFQTMDDDLFVFCTLITSNKTLECPTFVIITLISEYSMFFSVMSRKSCEFILCLVTYW